MSGFAYVTYPRAAIHRSFTEATPLGHIAIDNGAGAVDLTPANASKFAEAAQVVGTGDDLSLKIDDAAKTPGAYPLILVTYEIVCTTYADAKTGTFVKSFLSYTVDGGQASLLRLGYAPLPTNLQTKVEASIAKIG